LAGSKFSQPFRASDAASLTRRVTINLPPPQVDIPSYELDISSTPNAGERPIAGQIFQAAFGLTVLVVSMNMMIAMMANTYE
jgi:hypothetical protein